MIFLLPLLVPSQSTTTVNFRMFKLNFVRKNYLTNIPTALWITLCKFRCLKHRFPVEKFRQNSVDINLRCCTLCNIKEVGEVGKRIFTNAVILPFAFVVMHNFCVYISHMSCNKIKRINLIRFALHLTEVLKSEVMCNNKKNNERKLVRRWSMLSQRCRLPQSIYSQDISSSMLFYQVHCSSYIVTQYFLLLFPRKHCGAEFYH